MKMVNTKPHQSGANECLEKKKTLAVKYSFNILYRKFQISIKRGRALLNPNSLSRQEHIYI